MKRRDFILRSTLAAASLATGRTIFASSAEVSGSGPFQLPNLPYAPDALVPHIDTRTMRIHHGKHHAGYTRKLNAALVKHPRLKAKPIEFILGNLSGISDPAAQKALRDNGGGYYNHKLFWEVMAPANATGSPSPELAEAIDQHFGSMDGFQKRFTEAALSRFGSGWAWLVVRDGGLMVCSTPNQDNPLMQGLVADEKLGTPILGVDVWEHAYYLNYQNRRGAYLDAWWNVVNWDRVSRNFAEIA